MKFYDLHISAGSNSAEEFAKMAERLGWDGFALADRFESVEKFKVFKRAVADAQKNAKVEIFPAVEIQVGDPMELKRALEKTRELALVVIVLGGNYKVNRAACEDARVDILAHPAFGRLDSGLDEACLQKAFENNVAVEINFREILNNFRRQRSQILQNTALNLKLCEALKVKTILCSGAANVWEMRDPRQLVAVAENLGLELGKGFVSASEVPEKIIEKNKAVFAGTRIGEGVEMVK